MELAQTALQLQQLTHDSSPYDIATVVEEEPRGLTFNNDGTKMFIIGWKQDAVSEYTSKHSLGCLYSYF